MAWFLSVILAGLVCLVLYLIGWMRWREWGASSSQGRIGGFVAILAIAVFLGWAGGHTAYAGLKRVEDGHVAVVYQWGEVTGMKGDGLQFIAPWQQIRTESTGVQEHTFTHVSGFSAEVRDVIASVTVDYRVDREIVLRLYREVGSDWFNILVEPRVRQYFKAEVVLYDADEVVTNAEEIEGRVRDALVADIGLFGVVVEGLEISDWMVWDR
ncbi:MAG: SPFH domain-containing protein [Chloroflexi bacterium]|nr:SPFH domain-containing protein [Chloroflexota bacterium]